MAKSLSLNNVVISGNIVHDAEIKHVGEKNTALTKFRIANNQRYLDRDNNWQDQTVFIDVQVWGMQAEKGEKNLKKGIPVVVEGTLKEEKWDDKNGNKHTKILIHSKKIHFLAYPD